MPLFSSKSYQRKQVNVFLHGGGNQSGEKKNSTREVLKEQRPAHLKGRNEYWTAPSVVLHHHTNLFKGSLLQTKEDIQLQPKSFWEKSTFSCCVLQRKPLDVRLNSTYWHAVGKYCVMTGCERLPIFLAMILFVYSNHPNISKMNVLKIYWCQNATRSSFN